MSSSWNNLPSQPNLIARLLHLASALAQPPDVLPTRKHPHHVDETQPLPSKRTRLTPDQASAAPTGPTPGQRSAEPVRPLTQLAQAALGQYKSGQDLRNEAIQNAFGPTCPTVLARLIGEYDAPEVLQPLHLNHFGQAGGDPADLHTEQRIIETFSLTDPDSTIMQKDILENHHRAVLDPIFSQLLSRHLVAINNPGSRDSQAMAKRRSELQACITYYAHSNCDQIINTEIEKIKKYQLLLWRGGEGQIPATDSPGIRRMPSRRKLFSRSDNIDLFSETLTQAKLNQEKAIENSLERKLDLLLIKAQNLICATDFSGAKKILGTAFSCACQLRDASRIAEVSIKLIQLIATDPVYDATDILLFFGSLKKIFMAYPQALCSYAAVLFIVDDSLCNLPLFSTRRQLFHEAQADLLPGLPPGYETKFIYRQAIALIEQTTDPHQRLTLLTEALLRLHQIDRRWKREHPLSIKDFDNLFIPTVRKFNDLSHHEFSDYFSSLYQLAAVTINSQLLLTDLVLTPSQRPRYHQLSRLNTIVRRDYNIEPDGSPLPLITSEQLSNEVSLMKEPRPTLLLLATDCYKLAVEFQNRHDELEPYQPAEVFYPEVRSYTKLTTQLVLRVSNPTLLLEGLIEFYLQHQLLGDLEQLVKEDFTKRFKHNPDALEKLATGHRLLKKRQSELTHQ